MFSNLTVEFKTSSGRNKYVRTDNNISHDVSISKSIYIKIGEEKPV